MLARDHRSGYHLRLLRLDAGLCCEKGTSHGDHGHWRWLLAIVVPQFYQKPGYSILENMIAGAAWDWRDGTGDLLVKRRS